MAAKWPTSVATDADLFVAKNALATTLASTITNSDTTISLTSTTNFPVAGAVTIDQEIIFYTTISGSDLTGCVRGSDGTSIAGHNAGVPVSATIIAFHHNGLMAEIEAIETYLWSSAVANPLIGNLAAAGYKITGLGAGSTAGDSLRYEQVIGQFLLLGGGTLTGPLVHSAGSASLPSLTFVGDLNTGFYSSAIDTIDFTTGGVRQAYLDSLGNFGILAGQLRLINGSVGTPAVTATSDPDTGIYFGGSDDIYFSLGGTGRYQFLAGQFKVPDGTAAAPAIAFGSDTNTGIYSGGADDLSFATGGIKAMYIGATQACYLKGTSTNDDPAAGYYGEYIESVVTNRTTYPTSTQWGDLTSISLTAGDWDVTATLLQDTGIPTASSIGISTTTGNSITGLVPGNNYLNCVLSTAGNDGGGCVPSYRMSLGSTTTVYLKIWTTYSSTAPKARGRISARRVR